jgi:hypothetical protein
MSKIRLQDLQICCSTRLVCHIIEVDISQGSHLNGISTQLLTSVVDQVNLNGTPFLAFARRQNGQAQSNGRKRIS